MDQYGAGLSSVPSPLLTFPCFSSRSRLSVTVSRLRPRCFVMSLARTQICPPPVHTWLFDHWGFPNASKTLLSKLLWRCVWYLWKTHTAPARMLATVKPDAFQYRTINSQNFAASIKRNPLWPAVLDGNDGEPVRCSLPCSRPPHSCGQVLSFSAAFLLRSERTCGLVDPISML